MLICRMRFINNKFIIIIYYHESLSSEQYYETTITCCIVFLLEKHVENLLQPNNYHHTNIFVLKFPLHTHINSAPLRIVRPSVGNRNLSSSISDE